MHDVIRESHTERQTTLLVRANGHVYDSSWELHEVDLEEIVLAYLGRGRVARRALDPRGGGAVIWVSWRQQRTETLIAAAILALIAALLVPTGIEMASAYHHDGLVGAASARPRSSRCGEAIERVHAALRGARRACSAGSRSSPG